MKFKFLDELILTLSTYTITNIEFKTHPQQVIDWLDLHFTVFIIVLFSLLSVLLAELAVQNKILLKNILESQKIAVYVRLETVCYVSGLYLLRISSGFGDRRRELLC